MAYMWFLLPEGYDPSEDGASLAMIKAITIATVTNAT